MKKILALFAVVLLSFTLAACDNGEEVNGEEVPEISYEDGRYRGVYIDRDEVQVVVQFDIEDNVVTSASFRWLAYGGTDYRASEDETIIAVRGQHEDALQHLVGKDIREALVDLYTPGELDIEDVSDVFTGATIRANKIVSAVRDALNRGVYSFPR